MFGAKRSMRVYLDVVQPWILGEWDEHSFDSEDAKKERNDPSHCLFTIPERPLPGWFESLLLGRKATLALTLLIRWIHSFNVAAEKYNRTNGDRIGTCLAAHGVIGRTGSGTLKDAWFTATRSL